jgi:hypothetical protein
MGGLRLLPPLYNARLYREGLRDNRPWREGVFSLKQRRCNETKEYHRAQQSPNENDRLRRHENMHGGTSKDEEPLTITSIILRKTSDIVAGFRLQQGVVCLLANKFHSPAFALIRPPRGGGYAGAHSPRQINRLCSISLLNTVRKKRAYKSIDNLKLPVPLFFDPGRLCESQKPA